MSVENAAAAAAAATRCPRTRRSFTTATIAPPCPPSSTALCPNTRGTARTGSCAKHGCRVAPHDVDKVVSVGEVGVGVAAAKVLQGHAVADALLQQGGSGVGRGGRQAGWW
jgi:hypothetical protein